MENNWISVKDEFPKHEQQVWISFIYPSGEKGQGYAIFDLENKDWFYDIESTDLISQIQAKKLGYDAADVTHWMPLPEPPKE